MKCFPSDLKVPCHLELENRYEGKWEIKELKVDSGASGDIYYGKSDRNGRIQNYIVKYIRNSEEDEISREICYQNLTSKYNISPKILDYWYCKGNKSAIIIMEKVGNMTLYSYLEHLSKSDNLYSTLGLIKIFYILLNKILLMNDIGIFHFDMHLKNVMVLINNDEIKDVFIIDFGKAYNTKEIVFPLFTEFNDMVNYLDKIQKAYKSTYVDRLGIFEFLFVWLKDTTINPYLHKVIRFIEDKIYLELIYSNYTSLQKASWKLNLDDYIDILKEDLNDFLKQYYTDKKVRNNIINNFLK
jgi:serine/threonine protein kinase